MDPWNKILFFFRPLFLGDPNIELLDRGQALHFKGARRSDKGRYQCTVSNAAGKQARDIKLTIYSKCDFLMLVNTINSSYKLKSRVHSG